ncbi:ABC transporter permease family protein [Clostridium cadaveris]
MKICKYAYLNLTKKLFLSFIIMIQVSATCFLFYSVLDVNNRISEEANKILNVFNGKKAWYMKFTSEFSYNFDNDLFTNDEILAAFDTVKSGDFTSFYLETTHFLVKEYQGVENFIANPSTPMIGSDKYVAVKGFSFDKSMNRELNLKFAYGSGFMDTDFENISDITPVILGFDYINKYNVGDIISYADGINHTIKKLKVIGILEPDTSVIYKVDTGSKFINLNTSIIKPFIDLDKVPKDELLTTYRIQVFNFFNTSYFLFDASKSDEEIAQIAKNLNTKFKELNLGKLNISSVEKYLAIDKVMLLNQKKHSETLAMIVSLFLAIGIISSLLYSIKGEKNQIGVHILSGATLKDISLITLVQTLMIMIIGFVASLGLIKARYPSISYLFLCETFLMLIVLAILISIIPMRAIRKLNVNELIRSGE